MLKTRVTEMLGIEFPILQGGMLWVSRAELVAAVSNAGGLGILSSWTFPTPAELRDEIQKTKALTSKPFAVNIPIAPALRPLNIEGVTDTVIKEGVKTVETAGRISEPFIRRFKEAGVKVLHKCTAVRFARTAEGMGCDAVIIDGFECGGHPGEEDVTSLVLIPLTRDAISVPIIAAGGFSDGRGLVAALALGAEAVLMGTRFMATKESPLHARVKEWLTQCSETDTLLVLRSLRNTARVLRNNVAQQVIEMEQQGAKLEELAPLISGQGEKKVFETGELEKGLVHCGQSVGLIRDIPTVKELIDRIVAEAEEIMRRLAGK
ncbi:MAG: nitronate monooxygenase [Chloroflexi bacterium]|nr:nitronate monooxygenase [Chloroflexota bacterium]